ncbi:cation:dicarboxylase symporter family transporter [Mesorhizobium sp. M7A.F.Ca.US.011.01.1.1]|uniref:cation:dicarboxylate symporter family transporter n=1 Tax=Mesorhizobium sp. M7A.F.Ca.US.011.01.1.1 TaxID=2496741 RepID=UPI002478CF87|nr:cation:dicarboxylase symporter family transporter [Mesorhizobium sp. M7A.F.Ca.US.011.01.1.1]
MTTIAMIAAGILCGLYYPDFAHAISPVAQLYLNFLKMVVLPYLVSSVIFSITAMVQDPKSVRYLGKVGMAVLVVSFLSVLVSGTLSLILQPGQIENPQSRIELGEFINSQGSVSTDLAFPFQPPPPTGIPMAGTRSCSTWCRTTSSMPWPRARPFRSCCSACFSGSRWGRFPSPRP